MTHRLLWLAAATALAAACAPSQLGPTTFPAQYRFMGSPADIEPAPDCARYGSLEVVDGRADKTSVGERYLESGGPHHKVGMEGDLADWVHQGAEKVFQQAGLEHASSSGPAIRITLDRVFTDEQVYRQAEYDGKVELKARVSGGASWSGAASGFAENYGRPGSAENYQETVNHALDKALTSLVNDTGFRAALCK